MRGVPISPAGKAASKGIVHMLVKVIAPPAS
jgi:hypothetical protein